MCSHTKEELDGYEELLKVNSFSGYLQYDFKQLARDGYVLPMILLWLISFLVVYISRGLSCLSALVILPSIALFVGTVLFLRRKANATATLRDKLMAPFLKNALKRQALISYLTIQYAAAEIVEPLWRKYKRVNMFIFTLILGQLISLSRSYQSSQDKALLEILIKTLFVANFIIWPVLFMISDIYPSRKVMIEETLKRLSSHARRKR